MHEFGPPIQLPLEPPLYACIGFCPHLPDKTAPAALPNTTLENATGNLRWQSGALARNASVP